MTARTSDRAAQLRPWMAKPGDRYGLLLALLVCTYVISAFATNKIISTLESLLFIVTLLLALRTSKVRRPAVHVIMGITLVGSATAIVLALAQATDVGIGIANIWTALILLLTVGVILRRVLTMPTVSLQSIFGAVSAYMIIGLMFASIYSAMSHLESQHFFATGSPADTRNFQYFSFTTLTTLGYGDFTAGTSGGRAIAVLEAIGGQIFLATLVARLVASYRAPRLNAAAQAASIGNGLGAPERAGTGHDPASMGGHPPGTGHHPASATGPAGTGHHPASATGPAGRTGTGHPAATGDQAADTGDAAGTGDRPATPDRSGDTSPRRGNGARLRAARRPPVKWHRHRPR